MSLWTTRMSRLGFHYYEDDILECYFNSSWSTRKQPYRRWSTCCIASRCSSHAAWRISNYFLKWLQITRTPYHNMNGSSSWVARYFHLDLGPKLKWDSISECVYYIEYIYNDPTFIVINNIIDMHKRGVIESSFFCEGIGGELDWWWFELHQRDLHG